MTTISIKLTPTQAAYARMILSAYEASNHISSVDEEDFKAVHDALTIALQKHLNA